jgi:Domain of unknown function (DUF4296)
MRAWLFLLMVAFLLASCGGRGKVPTGIIPVAAMEPIIWQLMQADEYVNTLVAKDTTRKSSTERMLRYQQVFELNKTSEAEFKKSYQFYMAHPDITKVMFDSIIAKAGRQRVELYKSKTDSTVKAPADTAINRLKDSAVKHLNILAARHLRDSVIKRRGDTTIRHMRQRPGKN